MPGKVVDIAKYKAWLHSADPYQREIALAIFWHTGIRDEEIDQQVMRLLRTDDVLNLRRDAVRMLAESREEKFKQVLLEALDDEDWLIRGEAILGLKALSPDFKSIPRIIRFIREETHPFGRWCAESI